VSYKVEISKGALKQLKKLFPELQERIQVKIDDLANRTPSKRGKKAKR
jgi:mRNA interferase RelE/StbE